MTRVAAKILVEGFLHPGEQLEAEVSDQQGWLHVPVASLPQGVQFFHCAVGATPDEPAVEAVLIDALDAGSRSIAQAFLAKRLASATRLFLRAQAEGRAAVDCEQDAVLSFELAAAVAVVMFAAAWDESETIAIESSGRRYELAVSFDGAAHWVRQVRAA